MLSKLNFTAKISFIFISISLFLFVISDNLESISSPYYNGRGLPFTSSTFRFTDFFEISSIGFGNYQSGSTNYFPFAVLVINTVNSIFGYYSVLALSLILIFVLIKVVYNFLSYTSCFDLVKFFLIIAIPILFVVDRGNVNILLYTLLLSAIFLLKPSSYFLRAMFLSFIISVKPTFIIVFFQIIFSFKLKKIFIIYLVVFFAFFNLLSFLMYTINPFNLLIIPLQYGEDPLLFVSRLSTNYIALLSGFIYSLSLNQLPVNLFITSNIPTTILIFSYIVSIFYLFFKRPLLIWYNLILVIAPTFLIFPIISYYYNVLILLPAFIFWLRSPSINNLMARIESILFAIVFNSISWYHITETGYGSNSFIVSFCVIALFCISLLYVLKFSTKISNSSNSNNLST